jgi:hypothetical protein
MLSVFEALDLRKARGKTCKSDKLLKDLLVSEPRNLQKIIFHLLCKLTLGDYAFLRFLW